MQATRQPFSSVSRAPAGPLWVLGAALPLLLLAACAGYQLGPTGGQVAHARSIQVAYFKNETIEPRLVEPVAQALRRNLQQDGTFKLSSKPDADILLTGTLSRYERRPVAFQPKDVASVQEYEIRLTARVIATERATGKVLLDRDIRGRTTVTVGNDLASAERQAAPLLANDFARNVTTALAEGTW